MRTIAVAAAALGWACVATTISAADNENAAEASVTASTSVAAQIAGWVAQLDDDQFAARQWAQRRLFAAGAAALDAVAAVAEEGSLEASSRAVEILSAWSENEDSALRIAALEHLAQLSARPTEAALAEEALADVRQLAALERIREAGGMVVADSASLATRRNELPLQIIVGPHWTGGVKGLAHIADVHAASAVSLHSAPFGDAAAEELAKLAQIQRLEFYGTEVSDETLAMLRERLPSLVHIEVRSGAQLGIEGSTGQLGREGAYVKVVHEQSAAARGGLKSRDLITHINGEKVADFRALTRKIAACQPGDSADVTVLRSGKTLQLTVKFDRWGEAAHPGMAALPNQLRIRRPSQRTAPLARRIDNRSGRLAPVKRPMPSRPAAEPE